MGWVPRFGSSDGFAFSITVAASAPSSRDARGLDIANALARSLAVVGDGQHLLHHRHPRLNLGVAASVPCLPLGSSSPTWPGGSRSRTAGCWQDSFNVGEFGCRVGAGFVQLRRVRLPGWTCADRLHPLRLGGCFQQRFGGPGGTAVFTKTATSTVSIYRICRHTMHMKITPDDTRGLSPFSTCFAVYPGTEMS